MLGGRLTKEDIADFFSRAAFEKGRGYQAGGRVIALSADDDLTRLVAQVRGTDFRPYLVEIDILYARDGVEDISGSCSCPMAYNCKHVAATLLQALRGGPAKRIEASTSSPEGEPLSPEVAAWLDLIGKARRGDEYPPDISQRLLYILSGDALGSQVSRPAVTPCSVRLLKSGAFSDKVSKTDLSNFNPDTAAQYYRDVDIELVAAIVRERRDYSTQAWPIRRIDVLRQMIDTGRAYWRDHKGEPIKWGEPRPGRIEWGLVDASGMRPRLIVDGALGLNAEPPVYFDGQAGTLGPVELGMAERLAHRLLSGPTIRLGHIARVARDLELRVPDLDPRLLPPEPEPAIVVKQDPVPVLRLGLARLTSYFQSYHAPPPMPVASLGFRYGPISVGRSERATQIDAAHAGRLYRVTRRPQKERAAAASLPACGFVEARRQNPYLTVAHQGDFALPGPGDWLRFLHVDAPALRAQGFEIEIAPDFPFRLASTSGIVDGAFEGSGTDWFELSLGIDIDGERHDLAPLLSAMVSAPGFSVESLGDMEDPQDTIFLALADGRHVALAAQRLVPLILALHSLRLSGRLGAEARNIRLSGADLLPLLEFEQESFVFRGGEKLRKLAQLLRETTMAGAVPSSGFKAVLRPYQAYGVAWLDMLRECGLGGILADDMGLGKTVQILALLALEKARDDRLEPTLIVAPTSLMANWSNEAARFAPDLKLLVLHGPDRKARFGEIGDHDVVLTTYPLIARDHEALLARQWHIAVLDEAQTIKNPNAATTRWLSGVKAQHRFCLSGTPMENHLGELWSLMSFVNPGYLGDKTAFARNWRTPIEKRGDTMRSRALAQRIKPFLLRRTKAEVVAELPPRTEIVEHVTIEDKQRELYDAVRLSMSDKVRKAIQDRGLAKSHIIVLEALLKLRQVCCDPALLQLDGKAPPPSAKLERLVEMVEELLSEGRRIIVFSQFTSMLDRIRARFEALSIRYDLLTGDTRDRAGAIDSFQRGDTQIFLISLKAGGVGLNLTAADTVIIFDPWWNPAVEEQAIGRAHRIGQDKPVFVYRLMAVGTIEEKMEALKERKRALADGLFDPVGGIGSALTEADVAALFEE